MAIGKPSSHSADVYRCSLVRDRLESCRNVGCQVVSFLSSLILGIRIPPFPAQAITSTSRLSLSWTGRGSP